MEFKQFVNSVIEFLNLSNFKEEKKKKSIKKLLKKLEDRKNEVKSFLEKDLNKKEKKETKEELEIINYQIKKGKKLLEKLEKK